MRKVTDIFARQPRTFSFELFPPRSDAGTEALFASVAQLAPLAPDFVSVTYGAGGSTARSAKSTGSVLGQLDQRFGLTGMHHLTLVNQTREDLLDVIERIQALGIRNILALRGDPPEGTGEFRPTAGGLELCYQLIDLVRQVAGDYFAIGVAGFPEGHPGAPSQDADTEYLRLKVAHGAEFVITQFFFDNQVYSEYLERTARAGIQVRIIPGVLPVTDYDKLVRFAARCGAYICDAVHQTFAPLRGDPQATARQGADYATRQCEDLLRRGAPGLHFYCLNQAEPTRTVWRQVRTSQQERRAM